MKHAFVQKGEIIGDLLIPDNEKSVNIGLVWLPGLPNQPLVQDMTHDLVQEGFTVLNARYPGSWESYGRFGPSSSVKGAELGLTLLKEGKATDLRSLQTMNWNVDKVVLIGNSYGGAIAMTALATSELADGAVVFCPLLDPASQNFDPDKPEEDLSTMYPFLKRCHENTFRNLDRQEWEDFVQGKHLCNPVNYITGLVDERILLLHGKEDTSIRAYHTEDFYHQLQSEGARHVELHLVEGVGHGKSLRMTMRETWTDWLRKQFS